MENRDREKNPELKELGVRLKTGFRLFYLRILRLKGEPEEVAGGMAIGVFIGLTPTVPLQTILAVLIAFLLGKSKLAAALGGLVANPFLLPFIYILDYKVGRMITGVEGPSLVLSDFSVSHVLESGLGNYLSPFGWWDRRRASLHFPLLLYHQAGRHPLPGEETKAVGKNWLPFADNLKS